MKRWKVVIAGSGFSGAILAKSLSKLDNVELFYVEKETCTDNQETSTGFNLNPNGLAALQLHDPELASALRKVGLPRHKIVAKSFSGECLFNETIFDPDDRDSLAPCSGLRVRWRDAYRVLRSFSPPQYGCEVVAVRQTQSGLEVSCRSQSQSRERIIDDVDLLIAADGRYSAIRRQFQPPKTTFAGVSNFRTLVPDTSGGLFDDMELYYNLEAERSYPTAWGRDFAHCLSGLARIGIMKMPFSDDGRPQLYLYGNFPIPEEIPEAAKRSEGLRHIYTPLSGRLSAQGEYILRTLTENALRFHWVRMQNIDPLFTVDARNILFLGDSAHATVPTLGQGATSAIEDSVEAAAALTNFFDVPFGRSLTNVIDNLATSRMARAQFVSAISLEATEHLTAGNRAANLEREVIAWSNHRSLFRARYRALMRGYPTPLPEMKEHYAIACA